MSKYNSKKTVIDGIVFDSRKEAHRYSELLLLQKAGEISELRLQVPFVLVPKQKDEREAKYIADFVYFDNIKNQLIVEDVKGMRTREYILKRKIFKFQNPEYKFIET